MKKYFVPVFILSAITIFSQTVVINEAMSSNASTFADEDGEFPDWIELYNTTAQPVSLANYSLSDDPAKLEKWKFPGIEIQPHNFLLVYASGKDKKAGSMFWETIITKGDVWKYLVPVSEPSSGWKYPGFNDALWKSGPSGFGFGDNDDATTVPQTNSVYIRKTFTVTDIQNIDTAFLHVDYDDAFVAYLNGVEIARANIGVKGVIPPYTQNAAANHEANMYQGGSPDVFPVSKIRSLLLTGENVLAVQVHNINSTSSDLTLIPFFTFGMKTPIANPRGLFPFVKLPSSYLHTNFKLNADGDAIFLSDSSGSKIDEVALGYIPPGYSFGRKPDGGTTWMYFAAPTPKAINSSTGFSQAAPPPEFSKTAGFYYASFTVSISSLFPGGTIYYTMDGSEPVQSGVKYVGAIPITKTTTLRAKVFAPGAIASATTTATYFINHVSKLPVVSLSTDPKHFFDNDSGIYAMGSNPGGYPYFGANFWKDWERPIHFEFFEPADTAAVSVDAGVKINGNWSRAFDQKSLSIYLRGAYGYNKMKYQFFPDKNQSDFENVILRNSGNDFQYALIRDRYISEMFRNLDIGIQQTRFCATYLNGNYWGLYTLRERIDENFLKNMYGADPLNVELIEQSTNGNIELSEHYYALYNFIASNDLANSLNYATVGAQMDIENFKNYQIAEIFVSNTDWPGNNVKLWRPKTETGKWKWIVYDVDYGVGMAQYIFPQQDYKFNTLNFATATDGPSWPNPPWSTLFLRKFLENKEFKDDFIQSFAHLLNTTFSPDTTSLLLNKIHDEAADEVPRHLTKWTNSMYNSWETNVSRIREYVKNRDLYAKAFINAKFALGGLANLTLSVNDSTGGKIMIQSYSIAHSFFKGKYFKNIPIKLTAIPNPGYIFAGWSGGVTSSQINVTLSSDSILQAVFVKDAAENQKVVINEINYKSSLTFDCGDWVELYNNGKEKVTLTNWKLKDENDLHEFLLPQITMEPESYLVLVNDSVKFKTSFPNVLNAAGYFSFGLSSTGETVRLYNENGTMIDSVSFTSSAPWTPEPNGTGATLALINPDLDNTLAENWKASSGNGTPGKINDVFTGIEKENDLPKSFKLFQNYPNPFNPTTVISYQLSVDSKVSLKVFDILGNEVAALVNEEQPAGTYQISFNQQQTTNHQQLTSGVYFYQLRAGGFVQTQKMIILK